MGTKETNKNNIKKQSNEVIIHHIFFVIIFIKNLSLSQNLALSNQRNDENQLYHFCLILLCLFLCHI
ncbi:hypothetical protein D0T60_08750 [Bacteroides sp. 224]|nr:hypothetical protein [Bacteroides sp. 224]